MTVLHAAMAYCHAVMLQAIMLFMALLPCYHRVALNSYPCRSGFCQATGLSYLAAELSVLLLLIPVTNCCNDIQTLQL